MTERHISKRQKSRKRYRNVFAGNWYTTKNILDYWNAQILMAFYSVVFFNISSANVLQVMRSLLELGPTS